MKPHEVDQLIEDCLEGRLSEAEAARLSALLQESAEARARYWETALVHGLLENSLQQASLRVITGQVSPESARVVRWFQWRSLAAAAAGLMFGILAASMVWAYAMPSATRSIKQTVEIFSEGFENSQETPARGFPKRANVWSGDMSPPSRAEAGVEPVEGKGMMRLIPKPPRRLSYAWRIVDLADYPALAHAELRRLEVSASFNTPSPLRPSRYQVRLAALSQEPAAVRDIWNNEPVLFDTVLQHIGRNLLTEPDDPGWKTVQASLEIPPGTRSIVISLAAGESDPDYPPGNHYLDDVHARFVITQAPRE
jgi:hypothetical protein